MKKREATIIKANSKTCRLPDSGVVDDLAKVPALVVFMVFFVFVLLDFLPKALGSSRKIGRQQFARVRAGAVYNRRVSHFGEYIPANDKIICAWRNVDTHACVVESASADQDAPPSFD